MVAVSQDQSCPAEHIAWSLLRWLGDQPYLLKACGLQQGLPALQRDPQRKVALVRDGPALRREAPQQRRERACGLVDAQEAARGQRSGRVGQRLRDAGAGVQRVAGQEQIVTCANVLGDGTGQVPCLRAPQPLSCCYARQHRCHSGSFLILILLSTCHSTSLFAGPVWNLPHTP